MNRTALAIRMLQAIQSYGKIKKSQLAEILETNERNIYEFKKELETAGYVIISESGKYGGYSLADEFILKLPKLSDDEQESLRVLLNHLSQTNEPMGIKDSIGALEKVCASLSKGKVLNKDLIVETRKRVMPKNDLQDVYTKLHFAINNRFQVEIIYSSFRAERSLKQKVERTIYPYSLCKINHDQYVIGYDVHNQLFQIYKLLRIEKMKVLKTKYWVDPAYNISDYVDQDGFKKIGEPVRIRLKITGPYMKSLQEQQVGNDVEIQQYPDYIIYETTMRGEFVINEFILKMGTYCEVIAPEEVRRSIVYTIHKMVSFYKG